MTIETKLISGQGDENVPISLGYLAEDNSLAPNPERTFTAVRRVAVNRRPK